MMSVLVSRSRARSATSIPVPSWRRASATTRSYDLDPRREQAPITLSVRSTSYCAETRTCSRSRPRSTSSSTNRMRAIRAHPMVRKVESAGNVCAQGAFRACVNFG